MRVQLKILWKSLAAVILSGLLMKALVVNCGKQDTMLTGLELLQILESVRLVPMLQFHFQNWLKQ